ncbi:hypothetical protein GCM10027020_04750 [Nocardioides salsibiostraticola]
MTSDVPNVPSLPSAPPKQVRAIRWAVGTCAFLAVIGFFDGIVMAARRQERPCNIDDYIPEGVTDYTCYVHPQAGLGIAIVVMSVILGILAVLVGIVATEIVRNREPAE